MEKDRKRGRVRERGDGEKETSVALWYLSYVNNVFS